MAAPQPVAQNYTQPVLRRGPGAGWLQSIDSQIPTKDQNWNQDATKRLNELNLQYAAGARIGGHAVPFENTTKYGNYIASYAAAGIIPWHRPHWSAWQGDNGIGDIATPTSLTRSGSTAQVVTSTAHGIVSGQTISMNGMNETAYRGEFAMNVVNSTTLQYTVSGTPTTPATGNIGWRYGRQTYLDKSYDFIVSNPTFFAAGHYYGMCVEADQADSSNMTFKTPGTTTFNTTLYNQFQIDQVRYANAAFAAIGLGGKVHTWAISHNLSNVNLAGQTLDSGSTGNSQGLGNSEMVQYFNSNFCFDHYLSDTYRYADAIKYWDRYSRDLDAIHAAMPSCRLAIGEWGFMTVELDDGTSSGSNTSTTLKDTSKAFSTNQHGGTLLVITGGTGSGQRRGIVSNTGTQLNIDTAWSVTPDATSQYQIHISDAERAAMYRQVLKMYRSKSYIYFVNLWNHMGQNQSSIWYDNSSVIVSAGLETPGVIRQAFNSGNHTYGGRRILN